MPAADSVTVLRCVGASRATKRFAWNSTLRRWLKITYAAGAWFSPTEHRVANLAELAHLLNGIRHEPRAFVVRGALTAATADALAANPEHRIRRRKLARDGTAPTLAEVPRRWIMLDIDNWPLRPFDDLVSDPESAIEHAIANLLPEAFQDAECWWQLSASAGFVAGFLKVHLFFWLREPATNDHIKAVLRQHARAITDLSPFSAAQPLFVANPIVEGGPDPIPRRTGWRKGLEAAVQLPALRPVARPASSTNGAAGRAGGVLEALAYLGDGPSGEGFHGPLRTATMRYANRCTRYGDRDDAAVIEQLAAAIEAAPRRDDRSDHATYGKDYLQRMIDGAFALLSGEPDAQPMPPHHASPLHTLQDARAALAEHVGGFFDRALAWHGQTQEQREETSPQHTGLAVGVGTGKSSAARAALPGFIAAAKAAGQPHRVLWLVPTLKLADECLAEMLRLGIRAAVKRGREAEVPGTGSPDDDVPRQRMCLDLEAVADALAVNASVETAACGAAKGDGPRCPWRVGAEQCAFQRQKANVGRADVVIAAHQAMFFELAASMRKNLAAVVADESWWQAGLSPNRLVHLDGFAAEPTTFPVLVRERALPGSKRTSRRQVRDVFATEELHAISAKAERAFASTGEGELVSKEAAQIAGLTATECAAAYKLEWRRLVEGVPRPGQSVQARRKAMSAAEGNCSIPRRAGIWRALQALLEGEDTHTGRLQIVARSTRNGPLRMIALHSRRDVREEVAGLPILLLDAAMPVQVVRHYLPRLELLAEINPTTPHMRVTQLIGGWGKTSLCPSNKAAPDENRRRQELVRELADFTALHGGNNALVITYLDIEEAFARPGCRTAHFNAIAGLDTFKDVRSLFVIGRPLPDPRELRTTALALTGRAIPDEAGQVESRGARMADGSGAGMSVRAFADPDLEALRVAVTEAEVVQSIGRGRGVNRTAANPLDVFLFADVATALRIARLTRWADIRPNVVERMAARGLVLFSPADAARVYPDLFPSPDAARMAIGRVEADFPNKPLGLTIPREMFGKSLRTVAYRPAGRGQQTRRALVAPDRLAALGLFLTERLGMPVNIEPPLVPTAGELPMASGYGADLAPAVIYPGRPKGVPFSDGWRITTPSGRHVATVRQVSLAPAPERVAPVRSFYPIFLKALVA